MYFHCLFFRCKQLLDDIFVISRIPVIKVEVGIVNQSSRLRISQKLKLIIVSLHTEKNGHVFASSLMTLTATGCKLHMITHTIMGDCDMIIVHSVAR